MAAITVFANPRRRPRTVGTLTDRIEEIRYQHAEDGKWYKHKFEDGASIKLRDDGTALIARDDGRQVWLDDEADTLDNGRDDMYFLTNPGERRSRRQKTRKKRAAGTQLRAARKRLAEVKGKRRAALKRVIEKHERRTSGGIMATKRKRHRSKVRVHRRRHAVNARRTRRTRRRRRPVAVTHYAANPGRSRRRHAVARVHRRRHARRYRHNPRFGVNFLMEGLKDGVAVSAGQLVTKKLGGIAQQYVPGLSGTGAVPVIGSSAIAAVVTSLAARQFVPRASRLITAGAFSQVVNAAIAQTPLAGTLGLSAWPAPVAPVRAVGAWSARPALPAAGVRAWTSARVGGMRVIA